MEQSYEFESNLNYIARASLKMENKTAIQVEFRNPLNFRELKEPTKYEHLMS